ncbi:MAG: hypothetical protein HY700_10300 [Gemmatimonadetes bacterium]|nr:hypothetical protein [Gemmatimonadota bacterium]
MVAFALTTSLSVPAQTVAPSTLNFTQADLFLRFLRAQAGGAVAPALLDSVLGSPGTALVIRQQNISRTVTLEDYRTILLHAGDSTPPPFPPSTTERARRGIEGLVRDVWPAMHWGVANVGLLAERLRQLRQMDFDSDARKRALQFLPPGAQFDGKPFVVMGGRAGGAAFDGGEIYFDLLITSYRGAHGGEPFPSALEFTGYFAHEMHHLGLAPLIDRTRATLQLTPDQARAFDFLRFVVLEGSASYFVGPRDLDVMRRSPTYASFLNDQAALLPTVEKILNAALHESVGGDALDRAQAPLAGSGWHAAGALMLAAIDQSGGLPAVFPVMLDPRRLLIAYVRAGGRPPISSSLAEEVANMGSK